MHLSSQQWQKHKIGGQQSRLARTKARPYLQNNQSKKSWRYDSGSKAPA
jgi:hypothetical protein